ncbi:MAG: GH13_9 / GH13_8 / GH13 / CBM48 / GH13_ 10 / GH13_36, partial [uncultured Solirubrobacteraceae bacterium]
EPDDVRRAAAHHRPRLGRPARLPRRASHLRRRARAHLPPRRPEGGGAPRRGEGRRAAPHPPRRRLRGRAARRVAAAALRVRDPLRVRDLHAPRPVRLPADARRDRRLPGRRGAPPGALRAPGRARAPDRRRGRHVLRGVGAERHLRERHRRVQLLGRAPAPHALARVERDLGALRPRGGRGLGLQVRDPHPGRRAPAEGRPVRLRRGGAAADELRHPPLPARVGRRRVAQAAPRRGRVARPARLDLRGPPGLLAARPGQPGRRAGLRPARRRAGRLLLGHGLHPRRAPARHGPPVLRVLGLSGHLLLRPDPAPRRSGRLQALRGPPPRRGDRRDPRLGPGPLPARRLGPGPLRRDRPLRARRPAPGRPPRLGHARLQLRPQRGAQLPRGQRPLVAARVPRGRPAGRRRGLHALPGLLPRGGRVDPQPLRRPGEPRGRRLPQGVQRGGARGRARRHLRRRGVHGVAGRLAPDVPRRARVRLQVEHGLDARHAGVLPAGARLPQVPPPRADLLARLRLQRELHPAAVPRRGRARQGLAHRQDAGRPLAEVRQPALPVRVHVGPPRQAAAVHGPGVRPVAGVEPRPLPGLAPARGERPRRRPVPRARAQPRPARGARAVRAGRPRGGLRLAGAQRRRRQRPDLRPLRPRPRARRGRVRVQPLARAPAGVPHRPAAARDVARGARHGRRALRRVGRVRRPARRDLRARPLAQPGPVGGGGPAPARGALARAGV